LHVALCPGSFDPVTNGHLDIIGRAARLCNQCFATIFANSEKSPLFTVDERREMLVEATAQFPNVSVDVYEGLLSDYVQTRGITAVVKGLRAVSDFEYEFQMAQMNRRLNSDLETLFIMTSPAFSYLSSSILKEVARLGGDIAGLVPPGVEARLRRKYGRA
jgi:pantetheine-phosphate adenylyltransferase